MAFIQRRRAEYQAKDKRLFFRLFQPQLALMQSGGQKFLILLNVLKRQIHHGPNSHPSAAAVITDEKCADEKR